MVLGGKGRHYLSSGVKKQKVSVKGRVKLMSTVGSGLQLCKVNLDASQRYSLAFTVQLCHTIGTNENCSNAATGRPVVGQDFMQSHSLTIKNESNCEIFR